ncbi:hypothetical protein Q5M45_06915 [Acinetobacter pittii]|uniref:hypothetical protein n=1 Tax=Acinetobacter pittii TaxID=48296 RepID=UPI0026EE20BF|nr:hypothetical protein [Acinetobacter pittii]MDO7197142.1 hypothetical protein [Acinetobacter pittii]
MTYEEIKDLTLQLSYIDKFRLAEFLTELGKEEEQQNKDEEPLTPYLSSGITAFIDLLGFGGQVSCAETIADLGSILNNLKAVRQEFKNSFGDDITELTQATYVAASDSVIINIPFKSQISDLTGEFDNILNEITGFAYSQGQCIQDGIFLRGGIAQGWWYKKDDVLVSQSMVDAYGLEGKTCYPVIGITKDLYDFLDKHSGKKAYGYNPLERTFRKTIVKDIEIIYLDYIQICIDAIDGDIEEARAFSGEEKDNFLNETRHKNVESWFKAHKERIVQAHKLVDACNEKVLEKYIWLAIYHNEKASTFDLSEECKCHLT